MSEWKPSEFRKANPDLFSGASIDGHAAAAFAACFNSQRLGKSELVHQVLKAYAPDFTDYEPGKSYLLTWDAEAQKMKVAPVELYTPATPPSES